jgi:hypothetical protein
MGVAFKPMPLKGRMQLIDSGLKPYWGKLTVRNFRGGIGNRGMV